MVTENSMVKVSGTVDTSDIKRCKADVTISAACPTCGSSMSTSLKEQYLSYPKAHSNSSIGLFCTACEEYCTLSIVIKDIAICIEYDPEKIEKQ